MAYIRYIIVGALVVVGLFALLYYSKPNSYVYVPVPVSGGGVPTYASGVRGVVLLGPTCPVEQIPPNPACADKPYQTAVSVYADGATEPLASTRSAADGSFSFTLAPGVYVVAGETEQALPRCGSVSVTVLPDTYATATISCDTGIR